MRRKRFENMTIINFCRSFGKDKSGVIGVIFALAIIPLILSVGVAIDGSRAYLVRERLQHALDAAGLAVGSSSGTQAELETVMNKFFFANFPNDAIAATITPTLNIVGAEITVTGTATVDTTFMQLAGFQDITVSAVATIQRETTGLEVALVLDNTGSMGNNGKIGELINASNTLIDVLFGDETNPPLLKVSLIPYVTTVNIGTGNAAFVRTPVPAHEYPPTIDPSWKGCIEARPSPHDVEDTFVAGNASDGEWDPYYWEAETMFAPANGNNFRSSRCRNRWWRPPDPQPSFLPALPRPTGLSSDPAFTAGGVFTSLDVTPSNTRGPNQACPQPITPLTNDRATLVADINTMAPFSGNGTMTHVGAIWGLRTLSPGGPFTEGVAFGTPDVNKAMIILTDGNNLLSSVSGRCTGTNPKYSSQYGGYGYASEGRLGTTNLGSIGDELDDRLATVCENIKNTGVIVYTITFQLNDLDTQDLFRACASDPGKYFNAPTNNELSNVFTTIGAELRRLHISG
jgi:Flp pilus assembly protein TadG